MVISASLKMSRTFKNSDKISLNSSCKNERSVIDMRNVLFAEMFIGDLTDGVPDEILFRQTAVLSGISYRSTSSHLISAVWL